MSNYTKENLLNIAPSNVSAGTLAFKSGDDVFIAGNVNISSENNRDITKFEVWATDTDLVVTKYINLVDVSNADNPCGLLYDEQNSEGTLTEVSLNVPAGMDQLIHIRTDYLEDEIDSCNVSINWGDGTISKISNKDYDSCTPTEGVGEASYQFTHTYNTPGKYIIEIKGDYWGLRNSGPNIISRAFDSDLPLSDGLVNISQICLNSKKLFSVLVPTGMDLFANIINMSSLFKGCTNLLSAKNFSSKFVLTRYFSNVFDGCTNLRYTDMRLSQSCIKSAAYKATFKNCDKLCVDINSLLPERGFDGKELDISEAFYNCKSLTGYIPSNILWNDMVIIWTSNNTFKGSSLESQAPLSWGGTNTGEINSRPITRKEATAIINESVANKFEDLDLSQIGGSTGSSVSGIENVVGGYSAIIESKSENSIVLKQTDDLDMTKFVSGTSVVFNGIDNEDLNNNQFGNLAKLTISSVDQTSRTIYFDGSISEFATENGIVRILDESNFNSRNAIGDFNLVVGGASVAIGKRNGIHGYNSTAIGTYNTILSDSTVTIGLGNEALSGSSIYMLGDSNKSIDSVYIVGQGNETLPGQQNSIIIGHSNRKISSVSSIVLGIGCEVSGNRSTTIGFHIKNNQDDGIVIGYDRDINTLDGRNGVFINGHSYKLRKIDPLDDKSTLDCIRHEYKGVSKPVIEEIDVTGLSNIELDLDFNSRFVLTGSGETTIDFINYENGDNWEVFLDTNNISLNIDSTIVGSDKILELSPGKHLIKFLFMYGVIYSKIEL